MFYGALGWRAAEYAGTSLRWSILGVTTTADYEFGDHRSRDRGGWWVYGWDTGIWTNLTVRGNYPGVVILDDWFVLRMSGGTMKGWSMATPGGRLWSVVLSTSTRPTDTSTGTQLQVTLAIWNAMACAKRAGQIYGWCYNNNTLYSVDRTAWTVTPLVVAPTAVAVVTDPRCMLLATLGARHLVRSRTMTGGMLLRSGSGSLRVGVRWFKSTPSRAARRLGASIQCLVCRTRKPFLSRAERYGVAFLDGHLWLPSGYPYSW